MFQEIFDRRNRFCTELPVQFQYFLRRFQPALRTIPYQMAQCLRIIVFCPTLIGGQGLWKKIAAHAAEAGEIKMQGGGVFLFHQARQRGQTIGE